MSEERVLPLRTTPDGWSVMTIHHTSVPGYDFEAACQGLTEEGIQQELEINWSASKGKRVYPEFNRGMHVALDQIEFNPKQPLYCGWDVAAGGGTPAFVPTQINAFGQWVIFPPLAPTEDISLGVYEFGELVVEYLTRDFALPAGLGFDQLQMVHVGDPQGQARPPRTLQSPKELRSAFEILNKGIEIPIGQDARGNPLLEKKPGFGFKLLPGAVNTTDRLEAVRIRLKTLLSGKLPALVVDPRATTIYEGFLGGYSYRQRADGRYELDPDKNYWSHSMDAMAYIATKLFLRPKKESEEDREDQRRSTPYISHASSLRRR